MRENLNSKKFKKVNQIIKLENFEDSILLYSRLIIEWGSEVLVNWDADNGDGEWWRWYFWEILIILKMDYLWHKKKKQNWSSKIL